MKLTEAWVEIFPQITPGFDRQVERELERVGKKAGEALASSMEDAFSREIKNTVRAAAEGGAATGLAAARAFKREIERETYSFKLDVDTSTVAASLVEVKRKIDDQVLKINVEITTDIADVQRELDRLGNSRRISVDVVPNFDSSSINIGDLTNLGREAGEQIGRGITAGLTFSVGAIRTAASLLGRAAGNAFVSGFNGEIDTPFPDLPPVPPRTGGRQGREAGDNFVNAFDRSLLRLATVVATNMAAVGSAVATALPAVVAFTEALAPAVGLIAGLPAVIATGVIAMGILKAGFAGVGDAIQAGFEGDLKKFKKELETLPPAAQSFVKEIVALKPALDGLRASIPGPLMKGFGDSIRDLAKVYLPGLKAEIPGAAAGLNVFMQSFLKGAALPQFVDGILLATHAVGEMGQNMSSVGTNVLKAFGILIQDVVWRFDSFGGSVERASARFAEFIANAQQNGRITEWIDNAIKLFGDLWAVIKNVGSIVDSVFDAFDTQGQGLITSLATATKGIADFLKTAEGSQGLRDFASLLASISNAVRSILMIALQGAAKAFGELKSAMTFGADGFTGSFVQLAEAISPLIPLVGRLAGLFADDLGVGVRILAKVLEPIVDLIEKNEKVVSTLIEAYVLLKIAIIAARAAAVAWAAIMGVVNAVMLANPIGLVVIAIAALVAAVVAAYHNFEGFRKLVDKVWAAVKTAVKATVDWFVKTAWPALKDAWEAIGKGFEWLYEKAIKPAWDGIKSAIDTVWNFIRDNVIEPFKLGMKVLGEANQTVYETVIKPAWEAIHKVIETMWGLIKIIFGVIEIALKALGLVFTWLWNEAVVPAWNGIKTAIETAWNFIRDSIFNPIITFLQTTFKLAWDTFKIAIDTVWTGIKDTISTSWNFIRDNIFNPVMNFLSTLFTPAWTAMKDAVSLVWNALKDTLSAGWNFIRDNILNPVINFITGDVPNAWSRGVDAIGAAWDRIKEIAKLPIKFVIETVINNGLIKGLNWIGEKVGASRIDPVPLPFAKGGVLPGYTPGRDVHQFMSPTGGRLALSGGEAVMRPEFTKGVGRGGINFFNRIARTKGVAGVRNLFGGGRLQGGFADGGVLDRWRQGLFPAEGVQKEWTAPYFNKAAKGDGIGDVLSSAWDALTDPAEAFKKGMSSLLGKVPGTGYLKDMGIKGSQQMVVKAIEWIKSKIAGVFGASTTGGGGAGNWQAMWQQVSAQFPGIKLLSSTRPGDRTLSGNISYHSSGRAVDLSPMREAADWIYNNFKSRTKELITPWLDRMVYNGSDHKFSPAVEAQHGVGSAGNDHIHWAMANGGILRFDQGGLWPSGSLGLNTTGQDERVLNPQQTKTYDSLSSGELLDKLDQLIEAVERVAPGVGAAFKGETRSLVVRGRMI